MSVCTLPADARVAEFLRGDHGQLVRFGVPGVGELGGARPGGFGDAGLHGAGAEGRADDARGLEFGAHALHHMDRGALGSAVDGGARMRHQARHGGGIDDVSAFAVLLDARQDGDDAVDGAPEIDAHHPVPVGDGVLPDQAAGTDAGVQCTKMPSFASNHHAGTR